MMMVPVFHAIFEAGKNRANVSIHVPSRVSQHGTELGCKKIRPVTPQEIKY
jgi:hypothetical protein